MSTSRINTVGPTVSRPNTHTARKQGSRRRSPMHDDELRDLHATPMGLMAWFAALALLQPECERASLLALVVWSAAFSLVILLAVADVLLFSPAVTNMVIARTSRILCRTANGTGTNLLFTVKKVSRGVLDQLVKAFWESFVFARRRGGSITTSLIPLSFSLLCGLRWLCGEVVRMPGRLDSLVLVGFILLIMSAITLPFSKGSLAKAFHVAGRALLVGSGRFAPQEPLVPPFGARHLCLDLCRNLRLVLSVGCWLLLLTSGPYTRARTKALRASLAAGLTKIDPSEWWEKKQDVDSLEWRQDGLWNEGDACSGCVAKFVDCHDGDTCKPSEIWSHLGTTRLPRIMVASIRLRGIDTPEMRGSCALERCLAQRGKETLGQFVLSGATSRRRRIIECGHDKYFRYLCDILDDDGLRASDAMVGSGLATPWNGRGGRPLDWCQPPDVVARQLPGLARHVEACLASTSLRATTALGSVGQFFELLYAGH
jgi:micrococcal nuclease